MGGNGQGVSYKKSGLNEVSEGEEEKTRVHKEGQKGRRKKKKENRRLVTSLPLESGKMQDKKGRDPSPYGLGRVGITV